MSAGRHRRRHKRPNTALRLAAVAAPVLTVGAVGVGVATAEIGTVTTRPPVAALSSRGLVAASDNPGDLVERQKQVSRSSERAIQTVAAARPRVPPARDVKYATDDLDIRATATKDADVVETVDPGTKLMANGVVRDDYAQVKYDGKMRWVTAEYLSDKKPADPESIGLSDAPCPDGSVERGLTPDAVRVYRAVCNAFPSITSYGGWDGHGEHSSGRALDIMHPSVAEGYRIAEFLRAHASELNLYDVIWRQHIWTPVRAGEGWRSMPNRGSATANHYDHVHVSVN